MRISWMNVRPAVAHYLRMIQTLSPPELAELSITKYRTDIYHNFYRRVVRKHRDPVIDWGEWNAFARDNVFNPRSRWDNKLLQIQRPQIGNVFVSKAEELRESDSITTVYHEVRRRPIVSRLNVVVEKDYAGIPLYSNLVEWLSSHECVSAWKVMNPKAGALGPDSAVIYLNDTLRGAAVLGLVAECSERINKHLEAMSPFGLQVMGEGLYGFDVPAKEIQEARLGIMANNTGSAGWIIASVLSKAIVVGYQNIMKHGVPKSSQEDHLKGVLAKVLELDLTWELG